MSKIVVADLYQLARIDNAFSKEMKKLIRPKAKVQESYVDAINQNWQDTGKIYIVDNKATEEYYIESEITNEKRDALKTAKDAANIDVLKTVVSAAFENKEVSGKKKSLQNLKNQD